MIKRLLLIFLCIACTAIVFIWWRAPLIGDEWNKQTLYVCILDAWYGGSDDTHAHALWIDDDSTEGVMAVKDIADEVGIQPAFAVIADRMEPAVADSLASWQRHGAGIALHGFRHERWKDWNEEQIATDIKRSYLRLNELGFDTTHVMKLILPPHGCNTRAIRNVINQQGCQMVSGACLINPDRHVFQFGRISITPSTDIDAMRHLLEKAYKRHAFVIFGTHSSIPACFSKEKTRIVLQMAKDMGFCFNIFD